MAETGMILDIIRFLSGLIILSYASYTDIRTRRASNILWIILGSIGGIILLVQYFTIGFGDKTMHLIFIPIMIGLVFVLFQLRLIFGGADAKALMAIAILVPLQPTIGQLPVWGESLMPASWAIFSNSIILFLFIPIGMFFYNIVKRNIKLPYAFLGYMMSIDKAREKFVWPLEKLVDGKRKFAYMPKNFDANDDFSEFEKHNIKEIWVTPKIPFMIPLLLGFIFLFIFGDILYIIMNLFV